MSDDRRLEFAMFMHTAQDAPAARVQRASSLIVAEQFVVSRHDARRMLDSGVIPDPAPAAAAVNCSLP